MACSPEYGGEVGAMLIECQVGKERERKGGREIGQERYIIFLGWKHLLSWF